MPHAFAFRHSSHTVPHQQPASTEEESDDEDSDNEDEAAESAPTLETLPGVSETVLAEDFPLYLPSSLPQNLYESTSPDLIEKEIRVRLTLLETIFRELLRLLSVKMGIVNNKRSFVVGQKGNTRAQTLLASFSDKIDFTAERYRQVWSALDKLDPNGKWNARLKLLQKTDVRMPQEDEDPDNKQQQRKAKKRKTLGEGSRKPSWIWRVSDLSNEDEGNGANLGDGEISFSFFGCQHTG
jgi:hypothetical protein